MIPSESFSVGRTSSASPHYRPWTMKDDEVPGGSPQSMLSVVLKNRFDAISKR